jgi:pimeloyl-ACP methyl ester carboxylesterase
MEAREITLHGHRVSYRAAGSGPLLVLIHGIAGSSATWEEVMPGLATCCTVLAPDLLGHGQSAKPRTDYSLGAYASAIRDLIGALGYERGTLVGHSLGGGVAMQFAYQFPERCERLALISSGGLGHELHLLLRAATLPGAEWVLPVLCGSGLRDAEIWRSFVSLSDADARQAFIQTVRTVIDIRGQRVSATNRLYLAAELPTLIIWGEHDPLIPVAHAYSAHESIAGSRLEVFANAGHFPHRDNPQRFVQVLVDFMQSSAPAHADEQTWRERLRTGAAAR